MYLNNLFNENIIQFVVFGKCTSVYKLPVSTLILFCTTKQGWKCFLKRSKFFKFSSSPLPGVPQLLGAHLHCHGGDRHGVVLALGEAAKHQRVPGALPDQAGAGRGQLHQVGHYADLHQLGECPSFEGILHAGTRRVLGVRWSGGCKSWQMSLAMSEWTHFYPHTDTGGPVEFWAVSVKSVNREVFRGRCSFRVA